jgi:phosphoenolpyruvate carboxykinase (ATP)
MISAALEGKLDFAPMYLDPIFGFQVPKICPNVPAEVLNPKNTWSDPEAYDIQARKLAQAFMSNFSKYEEFSSKEILNGAPILD